MDSPTATTTTKATIEAAPSRQDEAQPVPISSNMDSKTLDTFKEPLKVPAIATLSRPGALKRAPSLSELVHTMRLVKPCASTWSRHFCSWLIQRNNRTHNPEKWEKLSKLDLSSPTASSAGLGASLGTPQKTDSNGVFIAPSSTGEGRQPQFYTV